MSVEIEATDQLVPQRKFAERIGRSPQLFSYWRKQNLGPAVTKIGREYFFAQSAIDEWMASGGNTLAKRYERKT